VKERKGKMKKGREVFHTFGCWGDGLFGTRTRRGREKTSRVQEGQLTSKREVRMGDFQGQEPCAWQTGPRERKQGGVSLLGRESKKKKDDQYSYGASSTKSKRGKKKSHRRHEGARNRNNVSRKRISLAQTRKWDRCIKVKRAYALRGGGREGGKGELGGDTILKEQKGSNPTSAPSACDLQGRKRKYFENRG